jgi:hypothetical protein
MPDEYTVTSDTRRQKADGTWEQKIKICVKNDGAATADTSFYVTSYPWDTEFKKIGKRRFDKVEFKVGEKCKEVVFEFPVEPRQRYTDLYKTKDGDTFKDRFYWNVDLFAAMSVPGDQTGRGALVAVLPIAYPFSLEQLGLGPLQFRVKPIGATAPWVVDFVDPAVGELVTLQPPEKTIPLAIGLSNPAALPEGHKHEIIIEVEPVGLEDMNLDEEQIALATAVYHVRIVKDTTPPVIAPQGPIIDRADGTVTLAWTVNDAVSGVRTPHLRYSLDGGRTWRGVWPDLSGPVFAGDLLISGRFTTVIPYCGALNIQYELLASDESLNTGTTGVSVLDL